MRRIVVFCVTVASVTLAGPLAALAQGTKDQNPSPQPGSATRSGVGSNNGSSDSMGGAFRGTGTPTYGTSPGMGSSKKQGH